MKALITFLLLNVFATFIHAQDLPPYYKKDVIPTATLAKNIRGTAFNPDGKAVYFMGNAGDNPKPLFVSYFKDNAWTSPDTLLPTKRLKCADPFISHDGSKLFFADFTSGAPLICMMEKVEGVWGKAAKLNDLINVTGNNDGQVFPTLSDDGTLYFTRGFGDIYFSKSIKDEYVEPIKLPEAINTSYAEWDACIARDERFIIFCSNRPGTRGYSDLYISYKENNEWTSAINLGPSVNSDSIDGLPGISPEGKYLFFISDRSGEFLVYQIDISSLPQYLQQH